MGVFRLGVPTQCFGSYTSCNPMMSPACTKQNDHKLKNKKRLDEGTNEKKSPH